MQPGKVLFVYRVLSPGGVEAVIRQRLIGLTECGVECQALFLKDSGGRDLLAAYANQVHILSQVDQIKAYLSAYSPDWLVNFDTPEILSVAQAELPGCRRLYEAHTTLLKNLKPLADPALHRKINGILVPSESQAALIRSVLKQPVPLSVVPNAIDPEYLVPAETSLLSEPVVVWIGRLEAHKNWRQYLDIVQKTAHADPRLHFWIIGGNRSAPQQHQILWQFIKSNGLETRFRWFPQAPHDCMPGLLQAVGRSGGCCISTSRNESFGLSVLEAMASGCPVVVPAVGGLVDLVGAQQAGIIYPPGNLAQASDAILKITGDPNLQKQYADQARKKAEQYTIPHMTQAFLEALAQFAHPEKEQV